MAGFSFGIDGGIYTPLPLSCYTTLSAPSLRRTQFRASFLYVPPPGGTKLPTNLPRRAEGARAREPQRDEKNGGCKSKAEAGTRKYAADRQAAGTHAGTWHVGSLVLLSLFFEVRGAAFHLLPGTLGRRAAAALLFNNRLTFFHQYLIQSSASSKTSRSFGLMLNGPRPSLSVTAQREAT